MVNEKPGEVGSVVADDSNRIAVDIVLAEYKALRDEIIKKMDNRTALMVSSITVSSAILGFGVERQSAPLLLIAPLVSILVGTLISHHNMQIGELSDYIQRNIEDVLQLRYPDSIGWHGRRIAYHVGFSHRILSYHLPLMLIAIAPLLAAVPLAWSSPRPLGLSIPLTVADFALLGIYLLHIRRFRHRL